MCHRGGLKLYRPSQIIDSVWDRYYNVAHLEDAILRTCKKALCQLTKEAINANPIYKNVEF